MKKDKLTLADIVKAIEETEEKHRVIIEYLLNKNSYPLSQWKHHTPKPLMDGIDYAQFFEDMEDFVHNLNK